MRKFVPLLAACCIVLAGCAYLDTPQERRNVFIGALDSAVLFGVASEINSEDDSGRRSYNDPPATGPLSPQ